MPTPELGRIEQVKNIRDIWPPEAHDFTPWLANNLHLLGAAVGMELKCIQTEASVGPYSLDILAEEVNKGVTVAIENQLEWTNFQHLAQILTYAAGRDARIAIWVAPEFRYESAQVLNWLNEWTSKKVGFYGVKFEVGDSADETTFHKVVYPGGWNKEITLPLELPPPPHLKQHHDFFEPLITKLLREGFADSYRQRFSYADRFFPSRFYSYIGYAVSLEGKNDAWVSLYILGQKTEIQPTAYSTHYKNDSGRSRRCFEAEAEWDWRRHENSTFSSINLRRDGSINDPPEKLEEIRAWMLEYLPKLKEVLDPHLERVLKELPSEGAADA